MTVRSSILAFVALISAACAGEGAPDRVPVYAEVVRHMTTEQGQPSGFRVIFLLERVVPNDVDPDDPTAGRPFSPDERAELRGALRDVAPVEFVRTRSQVVGPLEDGGRVEDDGIFLTLGPISGDEERALVPASSYLANLAASWQTWVVEPVGEGWHVTGTEGPVAVS